MKIGVLGSGAVGQALAKGFLAEGHQVWLATREPDSEKGEQLKREVSGASVCDFATAAKEAELAVFCVKWTGAEDTVGLVGSDNLAGKIVIETSNIISMAGETMVYGGDKTSAAEKVQLWFPEARVVKGFNTVGAKLMYKPDFGGETPTMFIAGDDVDAKREVSDIVTAFGWEPLDGGSLVAARELEAMALVWIRYAMNGSRNHAFKML